MKMKTLRLVIMSIAGIAVFLMTLFGIFVEKLNDNQQQPYASITIDGVKNNYTVNEPIALSVVIQGYGSGCGDTKAVITRENDPHYKSLEWYSSTAQCASGIQLNNFKSNTLSLNTSINQTGNYILTVSFDDAITSRHTTTLWNFSVMPYVLTGMTIITKENTFGINATVYHSHKSYSCPPDVPCFNPLVYYLTISAKSRTFLLNYHICDGNSCVNEKDGYVLMLEGGGPIVRLPDLHWNDGDLVNIEIQLPLNGSLVFDKNSAYDPVHTPKIWVDLGESKIISEY